MTAEGLETVMIANYTQVFRELLLSLFKTDPELGRSFLSQPISRQRDVESEVARLSDEMARSLVRKIKEHGYLDREPSDEQLQALINQTLGEFRPRK